VFHATPAIFFGKNPIENKNLNMISNIKNNKNIKTNGQNEFTITQT
jgi:hypothetical protein